MNHPLMVLKPIFLGAGRKPQTCGSVNAAAEVKLCLHDFTEQRGKSAQHAVRPPEPSISTL